MTDRMSPPTHSKLMLKDVMACNGTYPRGPMAPNSPVQTSSGSGSSLTPGIMFPDFSKCTRRDRWLILIWSAPVPYLVTETNEHILLSGDFSLPHADCASSPGPEQALHSRRHILKFLAPASPVQGSHLPHTADYTIVFQHKQMDSLCFKLCFQRKFLLWKRGSSWSTFLHFYYSTSLWLTVLT